MKIVIKQLHFEGGFVDCAGSHGEGFTSDDPTLIGRARKEAGARCGLGLMSPGPQLRRRSCAGMACLRMFGDALQAAPQPCLEPIDGFASCFCLYLSAKLTSIDIKIALGHHGSRHCGILVL